MGLYITFENGRTVDMGPMRPPHDAIGTSRQLLQASSDVAYVEWRDPVTDHVAFCATRVSAGSFGWKSATMPAYSFASLDR